MVQVDGKNQASPSWGSDRTILPFIEKMGTKLESCYFRVPGVTSISADTLKYNYCAKCDSTIHYRSIDYPEHQFLSMRTGPAPSSHNPHSLEQNRVGHALQLCFCQVDVSVYILNLNPIPAFIEKN